MNDQINQPRIFFFTGLGADERAFAYLKLNISILQVHVSWLKPLKHEPLATYCRRLAEKYKIKNGDILIGLSFGGMVVSEINKFIRPALSILISSAATSKELPVLYRFAGRINLHHLISKSLLTKPGWLKDYLFSLKKPMQKLLFDEIISNADPDFVQWAITKIVHWKNDRRPENLFKIHGTADRIMPLHSSSADFVIQGGSHFLTWENAADVSAIIRQLIKVKFSDFVE